MNRDTRDMKCDLLSLITAALAINDQFHIEGDHVEFTGSMNMVESFSERVNNLWHEYFFRKGEI